MKLDYIEVIQVLFILAATVIIVIYGSSIDLSAPITKMTKGEFIGLMLAFAFILRQNRREK